MNQRETAFAEIDATARGASAPEREAPLTSAARWSASKTPRS